MKKTITLFVFSCLVFFSFHCNAQWTASEGLDGITVSDIEVFDSIIYLCGSGGVYFKNIDAEDWSRGMPQRNFQSIESTDSVLFALGMYTFMKTTDHGQNWEDIFDEFNEVSALSTIGNLVIISNQDGLFKSTDQGESWVAINFDFTDFYISKTISFDSLLFVIDYYGDSLLLTPDLGNTWSYINWQGLPESNPRNIFDIVMFNDSIFAATKEGVFIFFNNEIGWELRSTGFDELTKTYDLDVFNDTLFCAGENGVYYFVNNEWEPDNNGLEDTKFNCLAHFQNFQFSGSEWGPFQKNENYEWHPIYSGLNHLNINYLAFYDGIIWACTNKGLFKTENNGTNFEHVYFEEFNECDQLITTDSLFYLNSRTSGLFISRDYGETWLNISGNEKYTRHIALGTDFIFMDAIDIVRADHINYDWDTLSNWVAQANVWELAAKDTILVATVYNDASYTSVDNGNSFIESLSSPAYEMITWNNHFYAVSPYNRLKISENGLNWVDYPFPDIEWYGTSIAANSEAVVVGGSLLGLTLYDLMLGISYDGGLTWNDVSNGLPVPNWPIMNHVNVFDNRVFAAPSYQGLWFRNDLLVGINSENIIEKSEIAIYPNPIENTLTIDFGENLKTPFLIKIFDVKGNVVKVISNCVVKQQIDLSDLSKGLYFIQVIEDKRTVSKKIIKL